MVVGGGNQSSPARDRFGPPTCRSTVADHDERPKSEDHLYPGCSTGKDLLPIGGLSAITARHVYIIPRGGANNACCVILGELCYKAAVNDRMFSSLYNRQTERNIKASYPNITVVVGCSIY